MNLFAKELEQVLRKKGYHLGQLDDYTRIHPEKVRRLQRSLSEGTFNVLNDSELDEIVAAFSLTSEETNRLRAAMYATSMQSLIKSRMGSEVALSPEGNQASEEFYHVILDKLRDTHSALYTLDQSAQDRKAS